MACGAGDALRTARRAGAAAFGTLFGQRELHCARAAEDGLVEVDLKVHRHVFTGFGSVGIRMATASAASEHPAEHVAKAASSAEERFEDVPEVGAVREVAAEVEAARPEVHAFVSELVVALALFGIGQHLVRFGCLLEFRLSLGVVRIAVRMPLHRELAVGALDLVG